MSGINQVSTAAGTFYHAYTDHLGNVMALSWTGGTFVTGSDARYDPFGTFTTSPTASNPAISNHGFTGHRHNNMDDSDTKDNDLGLIYMNARYYLPQVGRFISADTIVPEPGNPQSYNRYSYVNNNPLSYVDPSGNCLQYSGENGDSGELLNCLYAWNRLGEYYGSISGYGDQYPGDFMGFLLESASTNELIDLLAGYGIDYKSHGEQVPLGESKIDPGDYAAASISAGIGINGKMTLIVDKFGNVYLSAGGEIGFRGISGSLTTGRVQQGYSIQDLEVVAVDEAQLESLLTGLSMAAGGGMGVGGTFVGPFGEQNKGFALTEAGLYYPPQVGAGGAYSFMVYDANARPTLLNSRFEYWYWYHYIR